jgi:ferric-dicitrate binding protein FerR (iron transport regulator)
VENGQPKYDINEIAGKWLKGTITPEEKTYYEKWYGSFDDTETHFKSDAFLSAYELGEKIYHGLSSRIQGAENPARQKIRSIRWLAIAASVLLCLSFGIYWLLVKQPPQQFAQNKIEDIRPGGSKAILQLASGKKIILNNAQNGLIARQSNTAINKTANGAIVYTTKKEQSLVSMSYDTLSVPVAGTYHLTLSDGSKVWLNAATSIRYPENFMGKERKVELLYGEAYFEVIHDAKIPFQVVSGRQTIEDIGTHFNINAYENESDIKTTLFEGSIKVSDHNESAILTPGQQSKVKNGIHPSKIIVISSANTEEAVAWKNGYFRFNNEKIESIMRQLSRWYNINVSYEGTITNEGFYGRISRYKNISDVLKMLEDTKGVHFKLEGRRVTVIQ